MKKGDISASFLITVILGVLAFGIILIVYSQFNWTSQANQETCHESVIFRATLPMLANSKDFVPLKCQTEKICFTAGLISGKCLEFENAKGIINTKVSKKEQIEQEIAKKIIDCWEMMGQGKLSLFSNDWFAQMYGFKDITSSCVICSRIAFDKTSLAKSGINVQEIDVFDYMIKHYIPGKNLTYYEYLGGNNGKMSIKDENVENLINAFNKQINSLDINSVNSVQTNTYPNSDELSIMFMQVYAPSYGDVFVNTIYSAGGLLGGSFVSAPTLTGSLALKTLGALKNPYVLAAAAIIGVGVGGYQAYSVFNNNAIASGYCGDIAVGDKAYKGCSVVRTVDYGAEDLSKYCSTIESIA